MVHWEHVYVAAVFFTIHQVLHDFCRSSCSPLDTKAAIRDGGRDGYRAQLQFTSICTIVDQGWLLLDSHAEVLHHTVYVSKQKARCILETFSMLVSHLCRSSTLRAAHTLSSGHRATSSQSSRPHVACGGVKCIKLCDGMMQNAPMLFERLCQ